MIVNAGIMRAKLSSSIQARSRLTNALSDGSTVANYRQGVGLTGTTNASAWANQIGAAGALSGFGTSGGPAIQSDGSLLFNGTNHYMKAAPFTINQPETIYIVFKQVNWVMTTYVFDGNTNASRVLYRSGTTPALVLYAGTDTASNTGLAVGVYGVATAIFNGASSSLKIDNNAATTGNAGATNAGGFTLGANATPSSWGNIQVKEVIIRNVADSAGTQASIQAYLKAIHGTP